jgi:hypothetical protein
MTLATWNVLSSYRPGALAKLKDELNKHGIAVTAVQEIRWSGSEIFDSGDFIVCCSGNKERRQFGTGFLIKNTNISSWALAQKQIRKRRILQHNHNMCSCPNGGER